jgi:hypothetical protein
VREAGFIYICKNKLPQHMDETPSYLYHYTSIEALSLILKYRTIRFTRLDLVDDPEESETSDFGSLGKFCFVSCWTAEKEESIPMWKMYSNDLKGVRLKLPAFVLKKYTGEEYTVSYHDGGKTTKSPPKKYYSYINSDLLTKNNLSAPSMQENILRRLQYTDDNDLILPKALCTSTEFDDKGKPINFKIDFSISVIGEHKRKFWEFQKEYRYMFFVSPWQLDSLPNETEFEDFIKYFISAISNDIPQKYLDLEMDEKFKDMTITLGPKADEAKKTIVDLLIQQYNPTAKVEVSKVRIR